MTSRRNQRVTVNLLFTTAILSAPLWAQPASAQTIFCPSNTVSSQIGGANYSLQNGQCTNGLAGSGAFSGAALASQALSGLSQTSTSETNRAAAGAIANRREQEQQRALADNELQARQNEERERRRRRRDEEARAEKKAAAAQARRASSRAAARRSREADEVEPARRAANPRPLVRKGYDPEPVLPTFAYAPDVLRYGAFAQGYGDFEQRSGRATSSITYDPTNGAVPGASQTSTFDILQKSTTRTAGFLGGIDLTKRNAFDAGDGLILGLIGGYTDTSIDITTRTVPTNGLFPPAGSGRTRVSLSGPSAGGFVSYYNGGFSLDQTIKFDFYRLNQSFSETAGFTGLTNAIVTLSGAGSTNVTQFSAIGNLNYRYFVNDTVWFEPTVGYQYTNSAYDGNAAALGLTDGYLVRLQGGARIGFDTYFGATRLTTSLTGLAYENVVIEGGFIQAGAFGSNVIALNDEGKLRGQGILTLALDQGNGFAAFVQGDVRGGDRYFAAGGRAGFRYQW